MDGVAIVELYDRYARQLTGFFARRTGDPQVALDLLSDTFVIVLESHEQCRAHDAAGRAAWLFSIAANRLASHWRHTAGERRMVSRLALQRPLSAAEEGTVEQLAALAEPGPLTEALLALDERQRDAITRRVLEEQPYAEVSRELGVSEPAARARVSRGLRALRHLADNRSNDDR